MKELFDEFGQGHLPQLPTHQNPGLELVYLRHGHLVWQCDGKTEAVRPGSLYFTLPWQRHGSTWEFEPGHYWYFVVIRLTTERPDFRFPPLLGFDPATTGTLRRLLLRAPRHTWPATPLARVLLPALVEELGDPGPLHRPRLVHLTSQLVLELGRILSQPDDPHLHESANQLSRLLAELERTCDEPWTLEQMASKLELKRTRFSELFHHHTGDTPLRYLLRLRVERARRLLRTTDRSITDTAFACGFASSQHFARVFQQFTGVTASTYRRHGAPSLQLPRSRR